MTRTIEEHNPLLEAALAYARRGWHVFPLQPGGKAPLHDALPLRDPTKPKSTTNRPTFLPFAETAATEEQIRAWWESYPLANIGILTGPSKLLVVDIDPHKHDDWTDEKLGLVDPTHVERETAREKRRRELQERIGFEPTDLVCKTARNGWHLYYRHPLPPLKPVAQKLHPKGCGVDVQSGNYYVVAPPSRVDSHAYTWASEGEPASCPAWVIAEEAADDTEGPQVYQGQGSWRSRVLSNRVPEGGNANLGINGRNQSLRSLALAFARRNIPEDEATALLQCWNEARCYPPLTEMEVIRQVATMYGHHRNDVKFDANDRISLRLSAPPFPVEMLDRFPLISKWAHAVSGASKLNLDYCAFSALMGLGVAATGRYTIKPATASGWSPPTNMWGMAVLPSGWGKTPPFKSIRKALAETEDALEIIAQRYNAEIITQRDVLTLAKKDCHRVIQKGGAQAQAATDVLRMINRDLECLPPPLAKHWNSSDATPEVLIERAASLGWHVAMSDEGEEVLSRFFGHYSGGRSNISAMLKLWERGRGIIDRIGRGTTSFDDVDGSMFVPVQSSVLAALGQTEAMDRGWIARTLFCIPQDPTRVADGSLVGEYDRIEKTFGKLLRAVYYGGRHEAEHALRDARDFEPQKFYEPMLDVTIGDDEPSAGRGRKAKPLVIPDRLRIEKPQLRQRYVLHCPPDAFDPLESFREEMLVATLEGGRHHIISGAARKAHDYALRIAAILMLAETWGEGRTIERGHTEIGIAMMRDYFLPCHYVALDMIAQPPEADQAIHLLRVFAEKGIKTFTTLDVERELSCRTEVARGLLDWLDSKGAIKLEKKGRKYTATILPGVTF